VELGIDPFHAAEIQVSHPRFFDKMTHQILDKRWFGKEAMVGAIMFRMHISLSC
jgi:hypothetical protein